MWPVKKPQDMNELMWPCLTLMHRRFYLVLVLHKNIWLSWHVKTVQATKLTSPDADTSFTPVPMSASAPWPCPSLTLEGWNPDDSDLVRAPHHRGPYRCHRFSSRDWTSNAAPSCGNLSLRSQTQFPGRHQDSLVLRGASAELDVPKCSVFSCSLDPGLLTSIF